MWHMSRCKQTAEDDKFRNWFNADDDDNHILYIIIVNRVLSLCFAKAMPTQMEELYEFGMQ